MRGKEIAAENLTLSTSFRLSDNVPLIVYDVASKYSQPVRLDIAHPLPSSISPGQIVQHPNHGNWSVYPVNKLPDSIQCGSDRSSAAYFRKVISPNSSFKTVYAVDSSTKQSICDLLEIRPAITILTRDQATNQPIRNPIDELVKHVDGHTFEHFISDLWELQGWETEVTNGSADEGVDIVATRHEPYELVNNIQVKRYSETPISRPDIQQYSGLQQLMDVDTVAVVTSSSFSGPAEDWANKTNVKLVDGEELAKLIDEHDAYDLVREYVNM